jgi:hypothetical protein
LVSKKKLFLNNALEGNDNVSDAKKTAKRLVDAPLLQTLSPPSYEQAMSKQNKKSSTSSTSSSSDTKQQSSPLKDAYLQLEIDRNSPFLNFDKSETSDKVLIDDNSDNNNDNNNNDGDVNNNNNNNNDDDDEEEAIELSMPAVPTDKLVSNDNILVDEDASNNDERNISNNNNDKEKVALLE